MEKVKDPDKTLNSDFKLSEKDETDFKQHVDNFINKPKNELYENFKLKQFLHKYDKNVFNLNDKENVVYISQDSNNTFAKKFNKIDYSYLKKLKTNENLYEVIDAKRNHLCKMPFDIDDYENVITDNDIKAFIYRCVDVLNETFKLTLTYEMVQISIAHTDNHTIY